MMKAAVRYQYGCPDVVRVEEIPKPTPAEGEVSVRVRAVSLNASDWESLTGKPAYIRMWGLLKPKYPVLGSDIAGRVEAVGKNVTEFKPGDEVFGDILGRWGGFAEYVTAPASALTRKPQHLTFEQAATLPQAALVALQGLRDKGHLQAGEKVLINGAGGGAGSFAIQLAKLFGAEVTAVDNASKLESMRKLGADHVIDDALEDYTRGRQRYDLIVDFVSPYSIWANHRALQPHGRYVMVGGSVPRLFQVLLLGPLLSMTGKRVGLLSAKPNKDLMYMSELVEAGAVTPWIDKTYSLDEVPDALRRLGERRACGKLVITL